MNKPSMLVPALIGGAFLGVTSALPVLGYLNCACCMLIIGGGALASYFYLREYPGDLPPAGYGEGALLGLLTGVIGGTVWTLIGIPLQYVKFRLGRGLVEMEAIGEALSDPQIPEGVRLLLEGFFAGGPFSIGIIVISVVTYFLASLVFATLGGVLGIVLFRRSRQHAKPAE